MVGHTGSFDAALVAVETVDLQLARLVRVVDELGGMLLVTADHGNADEMYQRKKDGSIDRDKRTGVPVAKTSHTLNPVPFMIHDPARGDRYEIDAERARTAGIANVTATCLELLGLEAPSELAPSLVRFR
jgi:2,3-bisphosphoglycerate-independent phosphoglycerate mutase